MTSPDPQLSPEALLAIFDASPDGITVLDLDARLLAMNAGGREAMDIDDFGVCQSAPWASFWEGDARDQAERAIQAARDGQDAAFEAPARTFAGTPKWWEVRVSPIRDGHGEVTQLLVISRDITTRRAAEVQLQQMGQNEQALDAFVTFAEAVGSETDELALVQRAITVLHATMAHISAVYYRLDQGLWKATAWSAEVPPELVTQLRAGVPQDAPNMAGAVQAHEPVFVDRWQAATEHMDQADMYGAAAFVPLLMERGAPRIFAVGTQDARAWTAREQAVVRAVGRSLALALERSEITRQLQQQNQALEARTQVLEGFAALTRDLALDADRYALIRRTQQLACSLLPHGFAAYYEPEGDLWRLRAQVGETGNPAPDAGLPFEGTPNLLTPWQSGAPITRTPTTTKPTGCPRTTARCRRPPPCRCW